MKLKAALTIITVLGLSVLSGCNGAASGGKLLSVNFQRGQTLRYKFVSSREIDIDWGPTKSGAGPGENKVDKSSESMEMVVAYTPIEIEPCGLTTIKATCESVKTRRHSRTGQRVSKKDAVESFSGKSFTLTVSPTGKIGDYSQLDRLIREVGKKAFRPNRKGARIKEPDMICDFIATQWFLWDSVSSIEKSAERVSIGRTWKSKLSVPTPMVLRKARDVTYTLDEIRRSEEGQLAVIHSSYSLAESAPHNWPIPYSGRFQMSGTFGFLGNYKVLDLQGQGEELFDIDAGRTEKYNQNYQMQMEASLRLPLGKNPRITIKQNLTMQLLEVLEN